MYMCSNSESATYIFKIIQILSGVIKCNKNVCSATILSSNAIHIRDRRVIFGIGHKASFPFMVCYRNYNNTLSVPFPSDVVAYDDYLEVMYIFTHRVQQQIEYTRAGIIKVPIRYTHLPQIIVPWNNRSSNIVGKSWLSTSRISAMSISTQPISLF